MTGMDGKKDPGKFTVRFNLCDPQQRRAAELLNRQGRSKAQFITNALLRYADDREPALAPQGTQPIDREQLKHIVEDILSQRGVQTERMDTDSGGDIDGQALYGSDRDAILRTLDAFQQQ